VFFSSNFDGWCTGGCWVTQALIGPFILVGAREGFVFWSCVWTSVWRVDYPLFTFHLNGSQLPFHFLGLVGGRMVKVKSSQVCDLLSHMLWQMLSSFDLMYIAGPKGRNSTIHNKTFYCFVASIISLEFNITSLWDRHLPIGWLAVLLLLSSVNKLSKCAYKGIDDNNARFTNFDKNCS